MLDHLRGYPRAPMPEASKRQKRDIEESLMLLGHWTDNTR